MSWPTHPSLKFIGVRDMEKRIRDDLDAAEGRRLWDGEEEGEEAAVSEFVEE